MMNSIGAVLKQVRKELGLTQKQMAAGVVSPSYYSKVENGQHEIDAKALFSILDLHNYSINKFYERVLPGDSINNSFFWTFEKKIVDAVNAGNKKDFENVVKEFNEIKSSNIEGIDTIRVLIAVGQTRLVGTNKEISEDTKKLEKELIRGRDGKSCVYVLLANAIVLFDVDEGYVLMMEAISFFNRSKDNNNEDTLQLAAAACNYIEMCYEEKVNKKYILPIIHFVKNLPMDPSYIGNKLIIAYSEALFEHDEEKIEMMRKVFKESKIHDIINKF